MRAQFVANKESYLWHALACKSCASVEYLSARQDAALQVVTLRTDVLIRALGPMAGLLQRAFSASCARIIDTSSTDQGWSGSDRTIGPFSLGPSLHSILGSTLLPECYEFLHSKS
jgi:hypothetical protein